MMSPGTAMDCLACFNFLALHGTGALGDPTALVGPLLSIHEGFCVLYLKIEPPPLLHDVKGKLTDTNQSVSNSRFAAVLRGR